MPNAWVEHIKKYAKKNNLSYSCAMTMPDCKNSYKKTKESKTKETKINESNPYTKYDKPIGPVKPKVTKPYTKYDKPIGPVKPVAVPKPEKKPTSYYQSMIDKVLKEHVEPKPKLKPKPKPKETKPHTMYDKPIGPFKPKETKPHTMYDKPIGPVIPINVANIKKNEELINDIEKTFRSKSTRNIRALKKK
jgi:hypothetical protein